MVTFVSIWMFRIFELNLMFPQEGDFPPDIIPKSEDINDIFGWSTYSESQCSS